MKTIIYAVTIIALAPVLTGCRSLTALDPTGISGIIVSVHDERVAAAKEREAKQDSELMGQRMNITTRFANNPDTDAWKEQRAKISQAAGERVFSKDCSLVFDSLLVAVSSLELQVNNMERQSGYITASGISLSPTEAQALRRQAINDWCAQNKLDPSVLDRQFHSSMLNGMTETTDVGNMMAKSDKRHRAVTFRIENLGEHRTRVTLRFSEVYYPEELEAYYKLVWKSVDKEIFIDQALNGNVAQRQ
jgi:hypothetical protein